MFSATNIHVPMYGANFALLLVFKNLNRPKTDEKSKFVTFRQDLDVLFREKRKLHSKKKGDGGRGSRDFEKKRINLHYKI